jgi:hypothetical protein
MKRVLGLIAIAIFFCSCQESETVKADFTGNESLYPLVSGSTYPVNGTVTFKERKDGSTLIQVEISGTEGEIKHPVHLHLGNITSPDADIAALLNPVLGKTGVSETVLSATADELVITYQQLIQLNACIKIHLSDVGPDKNIILAAGNIGAATSDGNPGGRMEIGVCKSE